jgi:hypothetical protein
VNLPGTPGEWHDPEIFAVDAEDLEDEDWMEPCDNCNAKGVVKVGSLGHMGICPKCDGACWLPHFERDGGSCAGEAE